MIPLSKIILILSAAVYGAAFALHLLSFTGKAAAGHVRAFSLLRVGFLLSTIYFVSEAIDRGAFLPVLNPSQAMAFFAWSVAFVYLVLLIRVQTNSFGLILTPILFLLTLGAVLTYAYSESLDNPSWTATANPYFRVHIGSAFFAYASFTLSFAAGILYLIQHHELKNKHAGTFYHQLPSLEELEKLICQPLIWGAPLLMLAVAVGFLWSKSTYGEYWLFDPKTLASAVTAGLYFVILLLRSTSYLRGKQVAVLSVIAFCLLMFSFVGVRFIAGSHDYLQ